MLTTRSPIRPPKPSGMPKPDSQDIVFIDVPGLHEVYAAAETDGAAAVGFALAHISRLLARKAYSGSGPVLLWARHGLLLSEAGDIYPPGLTEFAIPPAAVTAVSVPDVQGVLQAGLEAARCKSLAAILVEFRGKAKAYDLTASRRLSLAAKSSRVALFLLRHGAEVQPSAAETRWRVKGLASSPLAANAPGRPAFEITLLRHRGGMAGQSWLVEWNRDTLSFEDRSEEARQPAPLPGSLASLPFHRQAQFRKAG